MTRNSTQQRDTRFIRKQIKRDMGHFKAIIIAELFPIIKMTIIA